MTDRLQPSDAAQLQEILHWAAAEERPLNLQGAGSKAALGRPPGPGPAVSLAALSGIVLYEPEELVLTARPGTALSLIEDLLHQHQQQLAFEPPDLGPLLGAQVGAQTLGGVVATNLAGPRRLKLGAVRDHLLGFHAVSGRGEPFKSGGRVVKNVTGYDLSKLMAGSYGTLAAFTELTLKVLPAPEKTRTVLLFGLDEARAVRALAAAAGSAHEASGLAHLPRGVATRSAVSYVSGAGAAVTAVRVEGFAASVAARTEALRRELDAYGPSEELHTANSARFWREVRDVEPLLPGEARVLWRISLTPGEAPAVAGAVAEQADPEMLFDWGGGLLWLSLPESGDAWHSLVRGSLGGHGHATLIRAPESVRGSVPVFQPQPAALAALTARVKDSFDPRRILNRGRMYPEV